MREFFLSWVIAVLLFFASSCSSVPPSDQRSFSDWYFNPCSRC